MITERDVLVFLAPALVSVLAFTGVGVIKELKKLSEVTQKILISMAKMSETVSHHEKRLTRLEIGKRIT
jgi:hypothetical protein